MRHCLHAWCMWQSRRSRRLIDGTPRAFAAAAAAIVADEVAAEEAEGRFRVRVVAVVEEISATPPLLLSLGLAALAAKSDAGETTRVGRPPANRYC